MEITVVGWILVDAPSQCKDCGEHADFIVVPTDDMGFSFELCLGCSLSGRYIISDDVIDKVFRELGL